MNENSGGNAGYVSPPVAFGYAEACVAPGVGAPISGCFDDERRCDGINPSMTDSPHVETHEQVLERRRQLLQERNGNFLALSARWNGIGNLRLLLFVLAAGLGLWWLLGDSRIAGYIAIPLTIGFVGLVFWHRKVGQERRLAGLLAESAQEGVWRLERNWEHLPIHHEIMPDPGHPYAIDLDLFGRGSLMHLMDTTVTPVGRSTLASWLLQPAGPETVRDRQQAVSELARMGDLRDRLAIEPRLAGAGEANPEPFIAWASDRPWLEGKTLLRLSALVLPVALFALLAAQLTGNLSLPLWMIPLAANLLISQLVSGETGPRIERAGSQRGSLRGYAALLRVLEEVPFSAQLLIRLRDQVRTEGHSPADSLGSLSRITRWWMPRSSLAYLPTQAFFAWDLNYLSWLVDRAAANMSRAAKIAASLSILAISAPENPTVRRAIRSTETSLSNGLPFIWSVTIALRSSRSGSPNTTRRSNRPGRINAGSKRSGRLDAPTTMT